MQITEIGYAEKGTNPSEVVLGLAPAFGESDGIETIAFQTVLCSTTLSVDELLAMGGEDAEAVLTHRFTDSSLTVG